MENKPWDKYAMMKRMINLINQQRHKELHISTVATND